MTFVEVGGQLSLVIDSVQQESVAAAVVELNLAVAELLAAVEGCIGGDDGQRL